MQAVSQEEVAAFCIQQPGWAFAGGRLLRVYRFPDFVQAMVFVNKVAAMAEAAGHHPDIDIRYNMVTLGLVTHDAGGVTDKDLKLAGELSAFV